RDVLAVYSDEPDWGLDDDVARLRGKGVSQAGEGMSTRMLRHFWYQGESVAGVDFGKDQEPDRRAQLYYELALVAFAAEEPYWVYDFLVDSNGWYEKTQAVEALPWRGNGPLLDLPQVIAAEQRAINSRADAVGDGAYEAFGTKIRYDLATTQDTIRLTSLDSS